MKKKLTIKELDILLKALKGLFPLTNYERKQFIKLMEINNHKPSINKHLRKKLHEEFGYQYQVMSNLLGTFRKKGVLNSKNEIHPLLLNGASITIIYEQHKERNTKGDS